MKAMKCKEEVEGGQEGWQGEWGEAREEEYEEKGCEEEEKGKEKGKGWRMHMVEKWGGGRRGRGGRTIYHCRTCCVLGRGGIVCHRSPAPRQ